MTVDVSETFFEIVFNIVRAQNEQLLKEIALREKVDTAKLLRMFKPTKRHFREFMKSAAAHRPQVEYP